MSILVGSARVAVVPDISGFGADLKAKIQAEAKAAGGNISIPVRFDVDPASAAKARAALGPLGGQTIPVKFDVDQASAAKAREALGPFAGEKVKITADADLSSVVTANAQIKAALDALSANDSVKLKFDANTGALVAATVAAKAATSATNDLTKATSSSSDAAALSAQSFRLLGAQIPLFAGAAGMSVSVFHLLFDAVVEFGAVAVPAFGAAALGLGAFALVATQAGDTAGLVADHLKAVYTVAQATGTQLPMLTHNFNDLTTAIRPQVWGLYGDAIDAVNSKFGAIGSLALKTGGVLDTFAARIVVDMKAGDSVLNTLLSAGQRDLSMFGGILLSLGNAFANLIKAAEKYHIAEDLLAAVGAAAKLLDWVTKLPAPLLAAGLAMHALYLWGGLAVTAVERIGTSLVGMATGIGGLVVKIGAIGSALINSSGAAGSLGDRLVTASGAGGLLGKALGFIGDNPWVAAITAGVVAVTALAIWMSRAKDATDLWVQASQKAVQNASLYNLVNTEASQLVGTNQKLADATSHLSDIQAGNMLGMVQSSHDIQELAGNHALLNQELGSTVTHASDIMSTFGTTLPGAYALAVFAGLKVSDMTTTQNKTWDTAMQKIRGVVTGYANMGQGQNQIGADISAVSYAASDQLKAIDNLNKAYDAFTKNLSAPVDTFISFANSIIKFGSDAQVAGAQMTGLGSGVQAMSKKVTDSSLQLQSDFQNSFTAAEQLFDAMRTSQAPADQQVKAIKDTVATLIPLAGTSKTAAAEISGLAQEAQGPATTSLQALQKWAGVTATQGMTNLQTDTNNAAVAMGNLSQDAQNLAGALQQDLTADMSKAIQSAVGVQGAMDAFTKSLHDNGATAAATGTDRVTLYNDLISIGETSTQANSLISALSGGVQSNANTDQATQAARQTLNNDIGTILTTAPFATTDIANLGTAIQNHGTSSNQYKDARAQLIADLEASGVQASTATTLVDELTTAVEAIPTGKVIDLTEQATGTWSIQEQLTGNATGGILPTPTGHAFGGLITEGSGRPAADDVLGRLSRNEYVVQSSAVNHYGTALLDAINAQRFAFGGLVDGSFGNGTASQLGAWTTTEYNATVTTMETKLEAAVNAAITAAKAAASGSGASIADYAASFIGKIPYVWGGTTLGPAGADCSGFTGSVLRHFGYSPPRSSEAQSGWVKDISTPQSGGLAFYHSPAGGPDPGHVAIIRNATNVISQGGGMGPQVMGLNAMPLLSMGIPPGGFAGGAPSGAGSYNMSSLEQLWRSVGGSAQLAKTMAAIAMAESNGSPTAHNASGASGLWQILGAVNPADQGSLFNPTVNAREALLKYQTQGLSAWATYTSGAYDQFMGGSNLSYAGGGVVGDHWYGRGGVIPEPVAGIGLRSGDRYRFGENGPETVTPGVGGARGGVNIQFFGPQMPSPEMQQAMLMKAGAMLGVS